MKSRAVFIISALLSTVVGCVGVFVIIYGLIAVTGASGSTATVIGFVVALMGGRAMGYTIKRWHHACRRRYTPPHDDAATARPVPGWQRLMTQLLYGLPWYVALVGIGLLAFPHSPVGLVLISVALLVATRYGEHFLLARRFTPEDKVRLWFWFNRIKLTVILSVAVGGMLIATGPAHYAVALIAVSAAVWILSANWVTSVYQRDRSIKWPFL